MPTEPKPVPAAKLEGWRIERRTDTKENVIATILTAPEIPEPAKNFLTARIAAQEKNIIRLDAHCHIVAGKEVYAIAITPL